MCVGVTVPQPTAEKVSQSAPAVTWPNICHISVAECRRQKTKKNPVYRIVNQIDQNTPFFYF